MLLNKALCRFCIFKISRELSGVVRGIWCLIWWQFIEIQVYFLWILDPAIQGILRSTDKIISLSVLLLVSSRSARGGYCKGPINADYSMPYAHALNPCLRRDNRRGKVSNRMQLSADFLNYVQNRPKKSSLSTYFSSAWKGTFQEWQCLWSLVVLVASQQNLLLMSPDVTNWGQGPCLLWAPQLHDLIKYLEFLLLEA